MFGLFKSQPFDDPQLGQLVRTRGMWRGTIRLPGHPAVPLVLAGTGKAPDAEAVTIARALVTTVPGWRDVITAALYEHYEPYGESMEEGVPIPRLSAPGEVWQHCALQYVAVSPVSGELFVELGFTVAWDEEHTLGARFRQGELLELNGSVLPP